MDDDTGRGRRLTRVWRILAVGGLLLLVVWTTRDIRWAQAGDVGGDGEEVVLVRRPAELEAGDEDDTPTPTDNDGTDRDGVDTPYTDEDGVDTPYTDYDGFNTPLTDGDGVDTPTPTDNDGTDSDGIDTPPVSVDSDVDSGSDDSDSD